MSESQVIDKADTLMRAAGVPDGQRQRLIEATLALSHRDTLDHWVELLPTNSGVFQ